MKIENLIHQLPFEGIKTKKIVANETGDIMLISLEQGQELKAHKSNTDACILVLEGQLMFKINDKEYALDVHDLFEFKKDQVHAITAISDVKLILIK